MERDGEENEDTMNRYLSGICISQLDSASTCLSDDAFLMSEPCLPVMRPLSWYSKQIEFRKIAQQMMSDVSACFRLGSMAREDADNYALSSHSHGCYNKITGVSCYMDNTSDETVEIGRITVDSTTYCIRIPKPYVQTVDEPVIGQLRFSALPGESPLIDWTSPDFDGWVYPDGSSYPVSAFEIDGQFHAENGFFRVPVLSDFIRLNSKPYENVSFDSDYLEFFPPHVHTADFSLSGELSGRLRYKVASIGNGSCHHGASKLDTFNSYELSIDCSGLKVSDPGRVSTCEETGTETFPSYYGIRTMIYIGIPKQETI